MSGAELLTTKEMARADQLAVKAGVESLTLMENAGRAVAAEAARMVDRGARVSVLCGPGNNGGDGFVAARHLVEAGYETSVALLGPRDALKGDAAAMSRRWTGRVEPLAFASLDGARLVVDALFGAGLSRPLDGAAAAIVEALGKSSARVLSVDVPSGLDGTTGAATGPVVHADRTVTFFRRKPGHLLLPGRELCGTVVVAQIGIPDTVLAEIKPQTWANCAGAVAVALSPAAPRRAQVRPRPRARRVGAGGAHGGGAHGCARRAAHRRRARHGGNPARRARSSTPPTSRPSCSCPSKGPGLKAILADKRKNAVLLGPGAGRRRGDVPLVTAALASGAATVIDADAITSFAARRRASSPA